MWDEHEHATLHTDPDTGFWCLLDQQVDGITADCYIESVPSPVKLSDGITLRGHTWLVVVVREWAGTGTKLSISQCNKTGVLYRREPTTTAHGHTYRVIDQVPFAGVWRIMSTSETPGQVKTNANLMPVGGWSWPGGVHDVLRMDDDGTWWEQSGVTMSDRTALSMVLSGTAVVQLRQVPSLTIGDHP